MKKVLLFLFILSSSLIAGDYWNASPGASAMKFLYLKPAPRAAALSGAGIAKPKSAAELSANPLATLSAVNPEIGVNQIVFSDKIDAKLFSLYYALPYENISFSAALTFLGYDDLEGRNEDGFQTGNFGASAYALQLGAGYKHKMFSYAISAKFASETIDDATAVAFLADGGASVSVNPYLSFGATITNVGYVSPFESGHEVPPTALETGITGTIPILSNFELSLNADLYRRADSETQGLFGAEISYLDILMLRAGYSLRDDTDDGVSAGIGIHFNQIKVEYAYTTNNTLDANHHIHLSLEF